MIDYSVDRDSDIPLYIQIRDSITAAIREGRLAPGDRLPPVSALAKEIGVTQATIRRALQDLSDAGHAACHVGRGTFIRDSETSPQPTATGSAAPRTHFLSNSGQRQAPAPNPLEFAAKRLRSGVRKALVDIMPLTNKPGIIQLTRGIPDGRLLPENFLAEATTETIMGGADQFVEATDELGLYELREEIAMRFNEDGADITPDQVLITNGAMQAISLVAQAALENRPSILCETPCFQGIPDAFSAMGHWVETIPRDSQGPLTERLYHHQSSQEQLLYLCPYLHNPTGADLSPERHFELAEWAEKTGSVIVADELFKELHFDEHPPPSLFNTLGEKQTIVVSSMSKSIMTGLRLGWLISSPERVRELAQHKRLMDHSTPALIQGIALTIFKSGKFDSHTLAMKKIYQERMKTMLNFLQKLMPKGVRWSEPAGGFSLLVELPQGYSSVALLLSSTEKGVSFLPGPLFDIDHRYVHALRLSTAWADKNEIQEGIELLASAIEELIRHPAGDSGLSGLGNFQ
ncbi:MAG: PLP-dependent aminotransferase family protein [Desulfopila sp.]|nr:PLP-dependent aminotransferase family protein [Desulfopila sp.]